jgi:hypothetical protein
MLLITVGFHFCYFELFIYFVTSLYNCLYQREEEKEEEDQSMTYFNIDQFFDII